MPSPLCFLPYLHALPLYHEMLPPFSSIPPCSQLVLTSSGIP